MWWHLGIRSDAAGTIDFVWEKTDEVLGSGGLGAAVPVFDDGTGWRRVSARHCLYLPDRSEFHFRVPCCKGVTQVAYCFPYSWERVRAFGREMVATGLAAVRPIGESEHGRPFELLEFGIGPVQVWVTARHHSGETPGAYVLEGMVREALQLPRLLRAATFHVAAAMDVDGVAEGLYGKDRGPRDFNRDYVSSPCRPEVTALIEAARAVGRVDLFLDLHGPAPGDCTFLVPTNESLAPVDHWDRAWEFGRHLEALAPVRCPVRVADLQRGALNWTAENSMQTSTSYFYQHYDALSLCLETSYHRTWEGRLLHARDWIALGRAVARAVAVQAGARRAPGVGGIARPPSLVPRFEHWRCVHLPADVALRQTVTALRITGCSPQSNCWMIHEPCLRSGEAQFSYRLKGTVKSVVATAKGFDPVGGLPTGAWESVALELKATRSWAVVTVPNREPARLMLRVQGLEGVLEVRVGE